MKVARSGVWPSGSRPAKDNQDSRPEDEHLTPTKIMNDKELLELDAWIAEHVMGLKFTCQTLQAGKWRARFTDSKSESFIFEPTTDPAAAMMVLEKCAEKTEEKECMYLGKIQGEWLIGLESNKIEAVAETLPLAICLFAKKLFDPRKL